MKRTRLFLMILMAVAMILGSVTVLSGQDEILVSKNSLYSYTLDANNRATIVGYNGAETSVSINKIDGRYSVVAIGDGAFTDQNALVTVELSGNITSIGDGAFAGCTALKTVRFTKKGLRTVGEDAFLGCVSLAELELPETVESIGEGAFYECSAYRFDLSALSSLKELGAYAFCRCGTTGEPFSVTIPDSLSEVGYNAFSGCSNIASFTVSDAHPTYTVSDGVLFADGGKTLALFPAA
ncbi:MAG: leucine-rich repeat domain-containing protein, partial [Ruminococcus sp.]|nr:leucine-rich repeat domain-containing protein [Candidatus Apopatosoma intestinale]